jgi:hypothetical protein
MPFASKPPIPPYVTRHVVIQLKGPKDTALIKRFNKELKRVARKYGASFKKRAKSKRAKSKRA